MTARRLIVWVRIIHAWTGAALSLLLAVLGLSGAALVFKHDYLRLAFPAARDGVRTDAPSLGGVAERAEALYGADNIRSILFGTREFGLSHVRLKDGGGAYLGSDGALVAVWSGNGRPEEWLFDLHHHLLAGPTGETVAGAAGLAAVLLIVSGLIAWWPARRATGWRVVPRSGARRDLLASHRTLGLVAAAPILLFAVTGAAMVFSQTARAALAVLGAEPSARMPAEGQSGAGDIDWPTALGAAQAAFPDAQIRMALWPRGPRGAAVRLRQPQEWHPNGRTSVAIDPSRSLAGALLDSESMARGDRVYYAFYPLHAAGLGTRAAGRLYDGFAALTGLSLFALGTVGLWAFVSGRALPGRRRRRRNLSPADVTNSRANCDRMESGQFHSFAEICSRFKDLEHLCAIEQPKSWVRSIARCTWVRRRLK